MLSQQPSVYMHEKRKVVPIHQRELEKIPSSATKGHAILRKFKKAKEI